VNATQAQLRSTVIIPVHNRASLTRQCLETILADAAVRAHAQVVVVDDGSSDDTRSLLESFANDIRVVRHSGPTGFATACNDGAAAAGSGEYLVFLNNDTLPVAGWLDELVDYADEHPRAAVVGAKLLFPNDTIQHAGMTITEDLNPRHIYAGFPGDHPAVSKSRRVPAVTAACALFRRAPFEEAGGFDDSFKNGFEDVDLCLRLGERGYEIHYCHQSVAYHLEMGTRDFRDELPNLDLYRRRWADKVQPDAIQRYLEDGLLRIRYNVRYPFSLEISPLLGVLDDAGRESEAEGQLADRADQVAELLRENVELRLLATEAGLTPPAPTLTPPRAELPSTPRAALFVSDAYGDSMRYRCDHHAAELNMLGATADSCWLQSLPLGDVVDSYGCYVLHRVQADEHIEALMRELSRRRKPVIFDIDDLLFEPGDQARGLDLSIPESDRPASEDRIRRHSQAMIAADAVFVPTEPLAAFARELNPLVFVIPSVADEEMLHLADEALESGERHERDEVLLGYISGPTVHDRDFLEVADEVLRALDVYPTVRLVVMGNLELDGRFARHGDRIERLPILPWRRVPAVLARIDVNLAPLERDNPFTESKSCIKWVEAGLVGVPTIASPRADFVRAVRPGSNGLLADSPEEWGDALRELIASADRRRSIGQAAFDGVRRSHTTSVAAPLLYHALAEVTGGYVKDRKLTINWLLAPSRTGKRPIREMARLARDLAWRGHGVRIFGDGPSAGGGENPLDIKELPAGSLPPADVAISTAGETARIAAEASSALFRVCLLYNAEDAATVNGLDLRYVCVGQEAAVALQDGQKQKAVVLPRPLEAEALEQLLLDLCFARIDPEFEKAAR
jgi:GT2 family glycosyltransferase/glycosyltransferase involved in cell wall biosynthesis